MPEALGLALVIHGHCHPVTVALKVGAAHPAPSASVHQFDTNGDGEITLAELQQAMQRLLGERLTPREISEVVQEADVNGDGTVDFEGDVQGWARQGSVSRSPCGLLGQVEGEGGKQIYRPTAGQPQARGQGDLKAGRGQQVLV